MESRAPFSESDSSRAGPRVQVSDLPWGRAVVSSALSFWPTNERMQVTAGNPEVEREVSSWKVAVSSERCGPRGSKPCGFLFLVTTRGLCLSQPESVQQENCLPREGHHQKFVARCGVRKHPRLSKGAPEPLGPFDILDPKGTTFVPSSVSWHHKVACEPLACWC